MMSHVREYLEDYDFEGMELDWLRNPLCCNPPAGQAQCDLVVAWIREIRLHTEARAGKLGKPFPLGLRIPGNLGYMKSIGVDVPRLVRDGLIDFIGFSNFWQTTWDMPYDELRRLVGPDVLIYGVVEDAPNWVHGHAPTLQAKSHPNLGIRYMAASRQMQWANRAGWTPTASSRTSRPARTAGRGRPAPGAGVRSRPRPARPAARAAATPRSRCCRARSRRRCCPSTRSRRAARGCRRRACSRPGGRCGRARSPAARAPPAWRRRRAGTSS